MKITRTQEDINDVLNWVSDADNEVATHFSVATYEQGVKAAIEWLLGYTNENPMD